MNPGKDEWWSELSDEDRAFIKRFLLASGSLKDLAKSYGISYPTVRLRLDRLIEKIRILDDQSVQSEFERKARALYADGKIDADSLKTILAAHANELKNSPSL